jgi:hypothetical protein
VLMRPCSHTMPPCHRGLSQVSLPLLLLNSKPGVLLHNHSTDRTGTVVKIKVSTAAVLYCVPYAWVAAAVLHPMQTDSVSTTRSLTFYRYIHHNPHATNIQV